MKDRLQVMERAKYHRSLDTNGSKISMVSPQTRQAITIRNIEGIKEICAVEALQREVWGPGDVVPLSQLVATREVGGMLIGAFDKEQLVGFVYGFIGRDAEHLVIHSHMLAVKPGYRNRGLGYKLKLAQRAQARALGYERVTWTFDPLQSRNAHLNFSKLGVIANRYKINFYGEENGSFIDRFIGTDRLWVTWLLNSKRVADRLEGKFKPEALRANLEDAIPLLRSKGDGLFSSGELVERAKNKIALIEIPLDITLLQKDHPKKAVAWREATRRAFGRALGSGYIVKEFYTQTDESKQSGIYLLSSEKIIDESI